jgi:hypothetical protein
MLNLTAGTAINTFDVRLNYSNIYNPPFTPKGVLRAVSIDYSNNIFSSLSPTVGADCIDGIPVLNQNCAPDDTGLGWIHFLEFAAGNGQAGPVSSALLFKLTFSVNATGQSIFSFNRVTLINPSLDPAGPHPHYVQYVTRGGVFANKGLVGFFNAQPNSPPAILAGTPGVFFDATGSYDADNPSRTILNYTWNFGDGKPTPTTQLTPKYNYLFDRPGNYSVFLAVADNSQRGNVTLVVQVLPNLGTLHLQVDDQGGTALRASVVVLLYNSSSSSAPFANVTVSVVGVAIFSSLIPGGYYVNFQGQNIVPHPVTENVIGGWTTLDTIYLTVNTPSPAPDYSGIIFIISILVFLSVIFGALVLKRRAVAKQRRSGSPAAR